MTALEYAKKIQESLKNVDKHVNPEVDLLREQADEMVKEAEIRDRISKGEKVLNPVTKQPVHIFDTKYLSRNNRLRNDMNNFLAGNISMKGSPVYKAVSEGYKMLLGKCEEDQKEYGDRVFDAAIYDEKHRYEEMENRAEIEDKELSPRDMTDSIMKQAYITMLKNEYIEAESMEKLGNDEGAGQWKEEILEELYSDNLDERVKKFAQEDPIGKKLYDNLVSLENGQTYSFYRDDKISYAFNLMGADFLKEYGLLGKKKLEKKLIDEKSKNDINLLKESIDRDEQIEEEYRKDLRPLTDTMDRAKKLGEKMLGKSLNILDASDIKYNDKLYGEYDDTYDRLMKDVEEREARKVREAARLEEENKINKELEEKKAEISKIEEDIKNEAVKKQKAQVEQANIMKNTAAFEHANEVVDIKELKSFQIMLKNIDDKINDATNSINRLNISKDKVGTELKEIEDRKNIIKERLENERKQEAEQIEKRKIEEEVEKRFGAKSLEEGKIKIGILNKTEITDSNTGKKQTEYERIPYITISLPKRMNLLTLLNQQKITKEEYNKAFDAEKANVEWDIHNNSVTPPQRRDRTGVKKEVGRRILGGEIVKSTMQEEAKAEEKSVNIQMSDDAMKEVKDLMPKEDFGRQADRSLVKPLSIGALITSLDNAQKGVFGGTEEYDNLIVTLKELKRIKENFETQKPHMTGDKLKRNQAALLHEERYLAELMKHYINRKEDEREKAIEHGGKERANSKMRRETVQSALDNLKLHMQEAEDALGLPRGRDRLFENVEAELKYTDIRGGISRVLDLKILNSMRKKAVNLREGTENGMSANDRMRQEKDLVNDMLDFLVKYKERFSGSSGFMFSIDGGKDGKIAEPRHDEMRAYQTVIKAYKEVSQQLLKDIAIYNTDELEKVKEQYKTNNEALGIYVNTDIQPVANSMRSYEELEQFQETIRNQYKQDVFNRELHNKQGVGNYKIIDDKLDIGNGLLIEGLGINESSDIGINKYKYSADFREGRIVNSVYHSMYADISQKQGLPFNLDQYKVGSGKFIDTMRANKEFDNNLRKVLFAEFDLSKKSLGDIQKTEWKNIDMSIDTVRYAKDIAFGTTLYSELSALNKELNKKEPNKKKVEESLGKLDNLKEFAKKIDSTAIYDKKIPGEKGPVALMDVEIQLRSKAQKTLKPGMEKNIAKENVKNEKGPKL